MKPEPADFDGLLAQYSTSIYQLAWRMTGSHEDARDLTQETFLRVYENLDRFRGESSIHTWIYTIAKNLCLRSLKKRKSFATIEGLAMVSQAAAGPDELTDAEITHLAGQVKEGCLLALLQCLTWQQRMAFVLHVFAGLSMAEVGQVIEKSVGAVKVLVHRDRRNLKAFLCANCSVYNANNPCRCVNLVGFSLKRGWISITDSAVSADAIEAEIREIKDITRFYRHHLGDSFLTNAMQQVIQDKSFVLLGKQV